MKKFFILLPVFILLAHCVEAQTFDEWFRQKKTQIEYLVSQIAAYEVFQTELTNGYNASQAGLTFIGNTNQEEFDLHPVYFSSLKVVSPSVSGFFRIAGIISYESGILSHFKSMLLAKNMNALELNYLNMVYSNMTSECSKSLDELIDIVTDDTFAMTDDERIKRIDAIYDDLKDKYAFSQSFSSETLLLSAERQSAISDINESLINNGLK